MALRKFAELWPDLVRNTPCCLFATDEEIAGDPQQYDCQSCPVADELDGLDPDNARAWRLYRMLHARLVVDLHCGGEVLKRLTVEVSDEDFADLWDRLTLLYDVLNPVKMESHGA